MPPYQVAVSRFASDTAARRFEKRNGRYETVSELLYRYWHVTATPPTEKIVLSAFGCNGHVTDEIAVRRF
jgi:hypothetical protein